MNSVLIHIRVSLASFLWDIGKQYRPRSDAADQGLYCLLKEGSIKILIKMKNTNQQPLNGNGLVQLMEWKISFGLNGLINGSFMSFRLNTSKQL